MCVCVAGELTVSSQRAATHQDLIGVCSVCPQGGQGTAGGPGQHPGQDHGVRHRRLLPDDPGEGVPGGEGQLEPCGHRDQARSHLSQ